MERQKNNTTIASDDSKQLLLEAAKDLFAKKGFDGTSVKELAEHAGLNVSLVSYYFGGKEGLYCACIDQLGESRLDLANKVLKLPQSFEEFKIRLSLFLDEMIASYVNDPDLTRLILRDIERESKLTEHLFCERFLKVFQIVEGFFLSAQAEGYIRKDCDVSIVSHLLFGILTHLARSDERSEKYFGHTLKDPEYRKKIEEHVLKLLMEGLTPVGPLA